MEDGKLDDVSKLSQLLTRTLSEVRSKMAFLSARNLTTYVRTLIVEKHILNYKFNEYRKKTWSRKL